MELFIFFAVAYNVIGYYIIGYDIIGFYIIGYYIIFNNIIGYYIIFNNIIGYYIIGYYIIFNNIIGYYIIGYYIISLNREWLDNWDCKKILEVLAHYLCFFMCLVLDWLIDFNGMTTCLGLFYA